eukprot:PITA_15812
MKGVYKNYFPHNHPFTFNYTGTPPNNTQDVNGNRVKFLLFKTNVQLILQDTNIFSIEIHPIHLHGSNFFGVGQSVGNYNESTDAPNFNLNGLVERNLVGVTKGGRASIRFHLDNPGVWFMHYHFEVHTSWGPKMVWVVKNGKESLQTLSPPPSDILPC